MKKVLTVLVLFFALFVQNVTPVMAAPRNNRCTWTVNQGKYTYCAGGFTSEAALRASKTKLWCGGTQCGGMFNRLLASLGLFGLSDSQMIDFKDSQVGTNPDGTYYTCFTGNFDSDVIGAINAYLNRKELGCAGLGVAGMAGAAAATGGLSLYVSVPTTAVAGSSGFLACSAALDSYHPQINGTLIDENGAEVCNSTIEVSLELINKSDKGQLSGDSTFYVCNQIPDPALKSKCEACSSTGVGGNGVNGIWTAVGCIPTSQDGLIGAIIRIGLGLSGGFALLLMIMAGFMFTTSQGDQKRAGEAKELMTSAVMGLLFIIFSMVILQFIGVSILKIPGFGS